MSQRQTIVKSIKLLPIATLILASAFASTVHADDGGKVSRALTRQEVRADLEAWQKAGLSDAWRGDATPDIYSADYQKKMAVYERLRAPISPAVGR